MSAYGASVEILGVLYIRETCDGFVVGNDYTEEYKKDSWEKEFEKLDDAIDEFLNYRLQENVGDDFIAETK